MRYIRTFADHDVSGPSACSARFTGTTVVTLSDMVASRGPMHPAANEPKEREHEDDDENEVELSEHGAIADIRPVSILPEYKARYGIRGAARTAGGNVDDDIGELQLTDDPDHHRRDAH